MDCLQETVGVLSFFWMFTAIFNLKKNKAIKCIYDRQSIKEKRVCSNTRNEQGCKEVVSFSTLGVQTISGIVVSVTNSFVRKGEPGKGYR